MTIRLSVTARVFWAIAVAGGCLGGAIAVQGSSPTPMIKDKLYEASRARLALARAKGLPTFGVILASAAGKNAEVANAIRSMGGKIVWRGDDVDYLEASVPIGRVEELAARDDVFSIDADESITVLAPSPPPQGARSSPKPTPSATHKPRTEADERPLLHPYIPGRDIQTSALRAAHPTYDGRGIGVAVVDAQIPDFLVPELQYGKTFDGSKVPKFIDMRTSQPPTATDKDSFWFPTQPVRTAGKTFTVGGVTYTAPYDGSFRFATQKLYQRIADEESNGNDGKTYDPAGSGKEDFGILWDERTGVVWVDLHRTHDFSAETGMREYAIHHDYQALPIKLVDPDARPSVGFVVQTDTTLHHLALLFGVGFHSSGSVGSVAASSENGGRIDGIAPGARLDVITPGVTAATIIEATIDAARNPAVNLIDLEFISVGSYVPHDGHFTESIIFDRLTRHYGKTIFHPANNDFGMSQVSEPCESPLVFCIGAYENRDSYAINAGVDVPQRDNLHLVDSFGPSGTGALRPQVLSPSGWISLSTGYAAYPPYTALKGVFDLPPGYTVFGGTSQATPTAAGAAAVLLSAAHQEHLTVTPERLVNAISRTARYLPNLQAYQQGNGLLQVASALQWLERTNARPFVHLSFEAPVRTAASWSLRVPNRGVGLFEREGWTVGARGDRIIRITRDNGATLPQSARSELVGNDGTFSVDDGVTLPLRQAARLRVSVHPSTVGAHSAILRLRSTDGSILGETLLTIVAGEQLSAANGYSITRHIVVPRPGVRSIFITVPPNAPALLVRVTTGHSLARFNALQPDATQSLNVSNNLLINFTLSTGTAQEVFPHPQAGTWEIVFMDVSPEFVHEQKSRPTKAVVSALIVGASARANASGFLVRQEYAGASTMTVTRQTAAVASNSGVIHPGEQRMYDVHVLAGSTGIGADAWSPHGTMVNLYLFDCTKASWKTCVIRSKSEETSGHQRLYYDQPKPGLWKLVVDGYKTPPQGSPYELQSYFLQGLPGKVASGLVEIPAATFATLGDDPSIYYHEVPFGPLKSREGMNPVIFDTQFLRDRR